MRKLAYVLAFIGVLFTVRLIAAPSSRPVIAIMQFHPANDDHWTDEPENTLPDVDHDHLVFNDDKTIDINLFRDDSDLAVELNSKGKDELVAQIMRGENAMNTLFGVGETKVLDTRLEPSADVSILSVHSKQELPDGTYERLEKYFIGSGQTLHAEIRWKVDADKASIKKARADFEMGRFGLAGREASR